MLRFQFCLSCLLALLAAGAICPSSARAEAAPAEQTPAAETATTTPSAPAGAPKIDPALIRTVTVKKTADIKDLVTAFVTELVEENTAGVQDSFNGKTYRTEEMLGRRMRSNPWQAFQWFVDESTTTERNASTGELTEDAEYLYVARKQLLGVLRSSWGSQTNVLARVRVKTHWTGKGSLPDGDRILKGTTVTMTFEGFVDSLPSSQLESKEPESK